MLVVTLTFYCPQCRVTQAFLMHPEDVVINAVEQKPFSATVVPVRLRKLQEKV